MIFASCTKKECQIDGSVYHFEIPVTLSPAQDTFRIGDTISIVSTFSDEVYERQTDRKYKLVNFDFFPETSIYKIDTVGTLSSFSKFYVIVSRTYNYKLFNYSSGSETLVVEYNYNNGIYDLKYKIIPQQTGLYLLRHGSSIFGLGDTQEFDGKCTNLKSEVYVNMNEGVDNNVEMLADSPDPNYTDIVLAKPSERFHKFGGYVFYVKE